MLTYTKTQMKDMLKRNDIKYIRAIGKLKAEMYTHGQMIEFGRWITDFEYSIIDAEKSLIAFTESF